MIAYIKGRVTEVTEETITVENHGMAYEIYVPSIVLNQISQDREIQIYTYLHVREDMLQLFGFLTKDDVKVFKLLITVNGIGPKGALGILSVFTADELRFAVLAEDAKAIAKTPGIGAKTASKLILELKDKLKLEDILETKQTQAGEPIEKQQKVQGMEQLRKDAAAALIALGYSSSEALHAIRQVELKPEMSVEDMLSLSLKYLIM